MSEKRSWWSHLLIQLFLLLVLISVLFPILWMVAISLDSRNISRPTQLPFLDPQWWANISLEPYIAVLTSPKQGGNDVTYPTLLKNSLIAAGGTSLLAVAVGTSAAYAFSRFRFPGREAGLMGFIVIQMIPAVGTMAPLFVLLTALGIRNTLVPGLVIAYAATTLPFAIWNMKGYMDTIPGELEQAALIDGCGPTQAFIRVILPLVLPALAITVLFGFAAGWTEFALAWLMLENPQNFTLAMVLRAMTSGGATRSVPWSQVMAFSVLLAIPPTILFLALQRYIVSGLTAGAVKG